MSKSLNQTGRPIFFALSCSDQLRVWQWANTVGNSWRTSNDISPSWSSFIGVLQKQVGLQKYSGPGGWNDPDALQIGINGMTYNQQYAQFAFWCILKAPLIINADLFSLSPQSLEILTNQQLIAINQDKLGIQAKRIKSQIGTLFKRQVWGGQLSDNQFVVVFLNRGETSTSISVSLRKDIGLQFVSYTQRDPIRHKNIGVTDKDILDLQNVLSHSVQVRILSLIKEQNGDKIIHIKKQ